MFDDVAVNSSVEHVVRGIAIDTGEVVWCVEFDAGAVEFLGGIAAAGPVVGALVLEPTTGEDVSDVDDAASDAVSFGIGIPPTQADALELSTASGGSVQQTIGVSVSRDDSVVWEDNVPGFVAALLTGPAEPIVVVLDQTGGTGELAGPAHTILTEHHGRGMPGTPTSMATSEA